MNDDIQQEPLTSEELGSLRKLIEHADQIDAEMKFKAAKRLVWKATKTLVLGVTSIIIALALAWDKVEGGVKWVFR